MIGWFERHRNFSIVAFILIAAEIFFFSSFAGVVSAPGVLDVSIIYHFSVFFLLNFFLLVLLNGNKNIKIKYVIIALIFSVVYSILDEMHQLFVPLRSPDLTDIITNNIGIFLSSLIYIFYKKD